MAGNVDNIAEAYHWSISQIARAFGMDRKTVSRRIEDAGIRPAGKKSGYPTYALKDAGRALYAEQMVLSDEQNPDKMLPGDRKDWYDSELKRLKVGQEEKRLVPDDEVAREMSFLIKSVVNPLDGLTDTLERKADLSPKQAAVVQSEIDAIREQMYLAALQHSDEDEEE